MCPSTTVIRATQKLPIMMLSILYPLFAITSFFSCNSTAPVPHEEEAFSITLQEGYELPYEFMNPVDRFELDDVLGEISGLSLIGKENLAAIEDETGVVYILNKKGKITRQYDFFPKGDFEGVEIVGDKVYVVKSNGDIYDIKNMGKDDQDLKIIETPLNKAANIEGLGFDKSNNRLLLAAKGKMAKDSTFSRSVYGFDLKTEKLAEEPVFTIDLAQVQDYLNSGKPVKYLEKISEKLNPAEGGFTFAPSGIAVHPITKNYYLISSVGKMMMVISPKGDIIHIEKFKKKIHQQPEGICFEKDGTLWISNEGKNGAPTLLRYEFKR